MANAAPGCPALWFEMTTPAAGGYARSASRQASAWQEAGVAFTMSQVAGKPFWSSAEIVECQALLAATAAHCA